MTWREIRKDGNSYKFIEHKGSKPANIPYPLSDKHSKSKAKHSKGKVHDETHRRPLYEGPMRSFAQGDPRHGMQDMGRDMHERVPDMGRASQMPFGDARRGSCMMDKDLRERRRSGVNLGTMAAGDPRYGSRDAGEGIFARPPREADMDRMLYGGGPRSMHEGAISRHSGDGRRRSFFEH